METTFVIYIGIYKLLGLVVSLILGTWYLSHRLTKVETTVNLFGARLTTIEGRIDSSFAGASPMRLLERGEKILNDSGLKKYLDDNKKSLIASCDDKGSMTNPYDIQTSAFKFMESYDFGNEMEDSIKKTAFDYGTNLSTVRRIAGIYFRDFCLEAHGFKPEELDTP